MPVTIDFHRICYIVIAQNEVTYERPCPALSLFMFYP